MAEYLKNLKEDFKCGGALFAFKELYRSFKQRKAILMEMDVPAVDTSIPYSTGIELDVSHASTGKLVIE